MASALMQYRLCSLLLICLLFRTSVGLNFTQCRQFVESKILEQQNNNSSIADPNATLTGLGYPDPIYHGVIRGFHTDVGEHRPLTLTLQGCQDACGTGAEPTEVDSAFAILTTWVLPVIALLSSVPYESNDNVKNLEAFANWFGSPAAALTTTIWNILMIRRCRKLSQRDSRKHFLTKDTLYILSCINQYQYPRNGRFTSASRILGPRRPRSGSRSENDDRTRDKALLRGVMFPFLRHPDLQPGRPLRVKLENLTQHLAFHLRLQRRKGVFPLTLSIVWFLFAFIISIVTAFAQLGDNTTAHSLALGLLLSWLPIIVVAAVVDRNPVSATRCRILIERWLYNVDVLFEETALTEGQLDPFQLQRERSHDPLLAPPSPSPTHRIRRRPVVGSSYGTGMSYLPVPDPDRPSTDIGEDEAHEMRAVSPSGSSIEIYRSTSSEEHTTPDVLPRPRTRRQWRPDSDTSRYGIKDYVGQGRRLRYCAVADTVLDLYESGALDMFLPTDNDADEFKHRLPLRPKMWYATWMISQVLVTTAFGMAFMVSFQTPTIGLGCRSLSYLIWYSLSTISWWVLFIWQEPPELVRTLAWIPDALAVLALFAIMALQLTGGLNTCLCKSSVFGLSSYGGYMDFANGEFYHKAYNVKAMWGLAAGIGLTTCTCAIVWIYRRWSRDASLWKYGYTTNM